jgi:hypothetical protein
MQIVPSSQIVKTEQGPLHLQRVFNLAQAVNSLDFGDSTQTSLVPGANQYTGNVNGQWANVTAPGAANAEFAIPHSLGRIPSFYFFIADRACNLYQLPNTGTAWTQTNIYVKCSVANAVLRVFIT